MGLITLPTIWVAKQLVPAALLNGDFNAILNQVNGNLDASNLADLAVTTPKIAVGAVTGPKIAMGSDAQGDILIRGAANYQRLAAGTAGKVLVTGGAGANPAWGYGKVVQIVNVMVGSTSRGTTPIPNDDSIPVNTEGDELMTLAITPLSATNKLKIEVVCCFDTGGIVNGAVALFQDAISPALAVACQYSNSGVSLVTATFTYFMVAGTTSAITFKVRGGGSTGTFQFNGSYDTSGRLYGGVAASSITITEIN